MVTSTALKKIMDNIRTNAFIAIKEYLWDGINDKTVFANSIRYNETNPKDLFMITGVRIYTNEVYLDNCGDESIIPLNNLSTELYISILEELEKNTHLFPEDNE